MKPLTLSLTPEPGIRICRDRIVLCESIGAACAFGATQSKWAPPREHPMSRQVHAWSGAPSYSAACQAVSGGVPEIACRVDMAACRVAEAVPRSVGAFDTALVASVSGESPDVGAYLSGEPECMRDWESVRAPSRIMRVVLNLSVSSAISAKTMESRGVVFLSAVDALERVGYRCEVWSMMSVAERHDLPVTSLVRIKDAGEAADAGMLAGMVATAAGLRWIHAALCTRKLVGGSLTWQTMGYPCAPDALPCDWAQDTAPTFVLGGAGIQPGQEEACAIALASDMAGGIGAVQWE